MNARSDGLYVTADTVLLLTVMDGSIAIATTSGLLAIECSHPRWIFRDYVAGDVLDFCTRVSVTDPTFDCGVRSVRLITRPRPTPGLPPLPDDVPVRDDWFLMETRRGTDYHPWESLQVVGITGGRQLVVGFSTISYKVTFPSVADVHRQFKEITDGRRWCHCTVHPPAVFFAWLPSHRVHCERIDELSELPDSLDGFLAVADFSKRPDHAAFLKKATAIARPGGPSIGL